MSDVPFSLAAGSGREPLILLHGVGGRATSFRALMVHLAPVTRVLSWDMPGHGASQPLPDMTFPALADAVLRLADAQGAKRVHLCGHSMGGMVALQTAMDAPDRVASLILIGSTPAFGGRDPSFAQEFLGNRLAPLDAGKSMADVAQTLVPNMMAPNPDPLVVAEAMASMASIDPDNYRQTLACLTTFNQRDRLAEVTMPTLVIAGEHDATAPVKTQEKMANALPHARMVTIPGAGHLTPMEAPGAVAHAITDHLRDRPLSS